MHKMSTNISLICILQTKYGCLIWFLLIFVSLKNFFKVDLDIE